MTATAKLLLLSLSMLFVATAMAGDVDPRSFVTLPPLPFSYDELSPVMDARTLRYHHGKHHAAYTANANAALNELSRTTQMGMQLAARTQADPTDLLRRLMTLPVDDGLKTRLRNHYGGWHNHAFFWGCLAATDSAATQFDDASPLAEQLRASGWQSVDAFKAEFASTARALFGSGWVWLVYHGPSSRLHIWQTAAQDNPLMHDDNATPLLALDVWEHAYYLLYQNDRAAFVDDFWRIVDWRAVETKLQRARLDFAEMKKKLEL